MTETPNSHIWADIFPAVVYLNGMTLFIGGLALILKHNVCCRQMGP
jgi:hypothetical protein